jgi:hypothetical protein
MSEKQIQALKLIATGTRLTEFGNALVSRQVNGLLASGLIKYAAGWMGYAPTAAGRDALAS